MALHCFGFRGAAAAMAVLLGLTLGCGGGGNTPASSVATVTIKGKVTYKRPYLVSDSGTGAPQYLDFSNTTAHPLQTLPARGLQIQAVTFKEETLADGSKQKVWSVLRTTSTSRTGEYTMTVDKGTAVMIQPVAVLTAGITQGSEIRLIPLSIRSDDGVLNIVDRPVYGLRKAADGTLPTDASLSPTSAVNADTTLDFELGLNDAWFKLPQDVVRTEQAVPEASLADPAAQPRSGSRPLAILDTLYAFSLAVGAPTPGYTTDLHWTPSTNEAGGTFVDFDRFAYANSDPDKVPYNFDGTALHFFGTIQGHDAYDEGILYHLAARNYVTAQVGLTPVPRLGMVADLTPHLALVEGISEFLAASVQKNPFLADFGPMDAASSQSPLILSTDVRHTDLLASDAYKGPYSQAAIAALSWKLKLEAQSLTDTPTGWAAFDMDIFRRYHTITVPKDTAGFATDSPSIYLQLGRLQEAKADGETTDLKAIFTNTKLVTLTTPFNPADPAKALWTATGRPSTGECASFLLSLGADPNHAAAGSTPPTFTFDMSRTETSSYQAANGSLVSNYANLSSLEFHQTRFTLTKDKRYRVYLTSSAPLPTGAQVKLTLNNNMEERTFDSTGIESAWELPTLEGNTTTPKLYILRLRLLSPDIKQTDPITVTLHLDAF